MEHFQLQLTHSYMLAPSIRHMAFQRVDQQPFSFLPGQFIQLHFEWEGHPVKRSYSVATMVEAGKTTVDTIELAVSYVTGGAATTVLSAMNAGDTIAASGAYGRFCLQEQDGNQRYLLIATGTGVTPYRAMLPYLQHLTEDRGCEVIIVFGARNPAELLYGDDFSHYAQNNPRISFIPCFSREMREPRHSGDHQGYVQTLLPSLIPSADHDIVYLCGNPNMVDTCFTLLKEVGLPIPHVRREKYVSPAMVKR